MNKVHRQLQALLPYCTVLLGGSHMRGQSTSFSDVDFFLVPQNIFGFFRLLLSRNTLKAKILEPEQCNIHITMPMWLQKHFFWIYGKDIHGNTHSHTILPKVLAYNNLKMAYKTIILIHSLSLEKNTGAQSHYTKKLVTYLRLLELGGSKIGSILPKQIDLFDAQSLLQLLPSSTVTRNISTNIPLDTFSKILLSLHQQYDHHFHFLTSPHLLRILQFFLALSLNHPRSAIHILFAKDIQAFPQYMERTLSSQDADFVQNSLNYAKCTYFWIVIR